MRGFGKLLVGLAVVMAISICAWSSALASETRTEAVTLSSTVTGSSATGYTVTFTAVTLKEGSSISDYSTGATKVDTVLRVDGYYVSTATFSAAGLGTETYPVSYHITVGAGRAT